jgi:hypothetical protein
MLFTFKTNVSFLQTGICRFSFIGPCFQFIYSHHDANLYHFTNNSCFTTVNSNIWIVRHEAIFPSSYLSYDDYAVFTLFITKDVRSATTSATVQSLGYGGGNMSAALDRIDELLKSGNTNVALAVMNLVTASLNSGSEVRMLFYCLP